MSKTYPRIGRIRSLHPNTNKKCSICGDRATHLVDIEYDYMRGNDETEKRCEKHLKELKP